MRGPRAWWPVRLALLLVVCAACAHAAPDAPDAPRPVGLSSSWSAAACLAADVDADDDGLDDRCELALASAFAPELVVDRRDCIWTGDAATPRLGGGYLFAAARTIEGVRIAYLPAYYRDCGWSGPVCLLRGRGCGGHAGDSELIVVDVAVDPTDRRWRAEGVFLSAHCGGRSAGRCRWYRGAALDELTWAGAVRGGAPRVWVARGKHAHYPSRAACDRGHWSMDSCDGNRVAVRFPVRAAAQNIGSRQRPAHGAGGCLSAAALPLGMDAGLSAGTRECMWDAAAAFRGWQADRAGAAPTPYARYLGRVAGF